MDQQTEYKPPVVIEYDIFSSFPPVAVLLLSLVIYFKGSTSMSTLHCAIYFFFHVSKLKVIYIIIWLNVLIFRWRETEAEESDPCWQQIPAPHTYFRSELLLNVCLYSYFNISVNLMCEVKCFLNICMKKKKTKKQQHSSSFWAVDTFFFFLACDLCARYHIMIFSWLNISNATCSLKMVVKDKVKRAQKN